MATPKAFASGAAHGLSNVEFALKIGRRPPTSLREALRAGIAETGKDCRGLRPSWPFPIAADRYCDHNGNALPFSRMTKSYHSDPQILGGEPVFVGTRVPIKSLFDHLEAGESIDEFLKGFPSVELEQIIALLNDLRQQVLAPA